MNGWETLCTLSSFSLNRFLEFRLFTLSWNRLSANGLNWRANPMLTKNNSNRKLRVQKAEEKARSEITCVYVSLSMLLKRQRERCATYEQTFNTREKKKEQYNNTELMQKKHVDIGWTIQQKRVKCMMKKANTCLIFFFIFKHETAWWRWCVYVLL